MQSRIRFYLLNILGYLERKFLVLKYKNKKIKYPPIFIIGAPRTGSTVLYQAITNFFNIIYINNYILNRFQISYYALKHSNKKFNTLKHNNFNSDFGSTKDDIDPSESSFFWYQWFPQNKHYVKSYEINNKSKVEIYSTITAMVNYTNKPIVFKNLNMGMRLEVIKDIFPNALFINVKRDIIETAYSIYNGRIKQYNDENKWFSVKPSNYDETKLLTAENQILNQIFSIEKQIEKDLLLFNKTQYININYADFCTNPYIELKKIETFFNLNNLDITLLEEAKSFKTKITEKSKENIIIDKLAEAYNKIKNDC